MEDSEAWGFRTELGVLGLCKWPFGASCELRLNKTITHVSVFTFPRTLGRQEAPAGVVTSPRSKLALTPGLSDSKD